MCSTLSPTFTCRAWLEPPPDPGQPSNKQILSPRKDVPETWALFPNQSPRNRTRRLASKRLAEVPYCSTLKTWSHFIRLDKKIQDLVIFCLLKHTVSMERRRQVEGEDMLGSFLCPYSYPINIGQAWSQDQWTVLPEMSRLFRNDKS